MELMFFKTTTTVMAETVFLGLKPNSVQSTCLLTQAPSWEPSATLKTFKFLETNFFAAVCHHLKFLIFWKRHRFLL